jgi:hypothetical protein
LRSITEKIHNDGALLDGFLDREQIFSWNPAILDRVFPGLTILANADDDVQAIVTQIKPLAVALRAITDESKSVVFEVCLESISSRLLGQIGYLHAACLLASPNVLQQSDLRLATGLPRVTYRKQSPLCQQSQ